MKHKTLEYINNFIEAHIDMAYLKDRLVSAVDMLFECVKNNKIMTCGNGGSTADCEHIAGELLKSFMLKREVDSEFKERLISEFGEDGRFIGDNIQGGIKCIPLTSFCAFNTAFINDCNEKLLFAQQVYVLGEKGDVLIAISTSGNSKNVIYAVKLAKAMGVKVIALTGESGGQLKDFADVLLNAPSSETYKIQEYHLPIYHLLCMCLENEVFGE